MNCVWDITNSVGEGSMLIYLPTGRRELSYGFFIDEARSRPPLCYWQMSIIKCFFKASPTEFSLYMYNGTKEWHFNKEQALAVGDALTESCVFITVCQNWRTLTYTHTYIWYPPHSLLTAYNRQLIGSLLLQSKVAMATRTSTTVRTMFKDGKKMTVKTVTVTSPNVGTKYFLGIR